MKAAYLADKGETVQKVMKQESQYTESQVNRYEKLWKRWAEKKSSLRPWKQMKQTEIMTV